MTKIAILCTSATTFGKSAEKKPTGVWLEEIAVPYYSLLEKKFSVDFFTAQALMKTSKGLSELNVEEYDGVFLPGGHGCCTDFYQNQELAKTIEQFLTAKKAVALDCHAPIALLSCKKADGTTPLVSGMSVTGFSDEEEGQVGMQEEVPALIEKEMVAQGAKYSKAEGAWGAHAVVDGTLVTGQNPASSKVCVEKFVELLALTQTQVVN